MDRLTQKETAGRNLINGRYMLKECLFASDLGTLYKARDTRQEDAGGAGTSVLIHFLPNRTIAYNELPGLFPVLQSYTETLDCPVLKMVDYGWSGTVAYFIMLAPESWSVNVLPDFQEPPSSLHQNAIRITRDLLHKGIISAGLVPQAFLVMPGGLYLLPTALMENFQSLQGREALLPLKEHPGKSGRWMSFLGWGTAVGFAAAGSGYIYHLYQQDEIPRNTPLQEPFVGKSESQITTEKTVMPSKTDNSVLMAESVPVSFEPSQLDRPEAGSGTLLAVVEQEEFPVTLQQETAPQNMDSTQEDLAAKPGTAEDVKEEAVVDQSEPDTPLTSSGEEESADKNNTAQVEDISDKPNAVENVKEEAVAAPLKHEEPLINSGETDEPEQKESEVQTSEPEPLSHKKTIVMNPNINSGQSSRVATKKLAGQKIENEEAKSSPVSPNVQASDTKTKPVKPVTQSQQRPLVIHSQPIQNIPVPIEPAPVVPKIPKVEPARVAAIEPANLAANHPVLSVQSRKEKALAEARVRNKPVAKTSGSKIKKSSQRSPRLTANGLTSDQLIDSAYKAIRSGQLGEVPGRGAIYYIRLVKRIDRGNPQINRMARKVVSTYHIKARDAIRNKHESAARQLLWMAGRIIKEFNLIKMNKSHEILKHRLGE